MSGPTWSFTGEKRLDNFFDHFFIRNNLVPGHSAGQGGNAPSSHTRDVATDLYLRRSTLHTVAEGGQQGQAGLQQGKGMELHAARAALSIAEVDLLRRKEFIRRRDAGEIDQRVKGEEYIDKIRRQVGWPFSIGQQPTMAEMMEKEDGDPLYPQRRMKDWDRKWDREPLAVVKVATEEQQQDPNFVALAGPLGYEKGYLEVKEAEGEPNTESFKAAGWYWSGPEKRPALLDVMVWKPLSKAGPAIISALDAKKTEENLRLGRTLAEPDALAVKRTMKHEYQVKDLLHGGHKTIAFADHGAFYTNVNVRDPLTGMTLYSYNQKQHTVTSAIGQGVIEKDLLLQRKVKKKNLMLLQSRDLEMELNAQNGTVRELEEKYRGGKMPLGMTRDKINTCLTKIEALEVDKRGVDNRLAMEKREIIALETELEKSGIANDLPLPRAVMLATPTPLLQGMRSVKDAVDDTARAIGVVSAKGYRPGQGMEGASVWDKVMEGFGDQKGPGFEDAETYFGEALVDPVTGKFNDKVLQRRNGDSQRRDLEVNKAIADVMLATSDGASRYARPNPQQLKMERAARKEQQDVVDSLVKTAIRGHPTGSLEAWAESDERTRSTYGSSEHPRPTPVMSTIQVGDGKYLTMKTLAAAPKQPGAEKLPANAVSWKCSSGKGIGGGRYKQGMELAGWDMEDSESWEAAKKPSRSAAGVGYTPNQTFCGKALTVKAGEAASPGPYKSSIVEEQAYNGNKSDRYRPKPRKVEL